MSNKSNGEPRRFELLAIAPVRSFVEASAYTKALSEHGVDAGAMTVQGEPYRPQSDFRLYWIGAGADIETDFFTHLWRIVPIGAEQHRNIFFVAADQAPLPSENIAPFLRRYPRFAREDMEGALKHITHMRMRRAAERRKLREPVQLWSTICSTGVAGPPPPLVSPQESRRFHQARIAELIAKKQSSGEPPDPILDKGLPRWIEQYLQHRELRPPEDHGPWMALVAPLFSRHPLYVVAALDDLERKICDGRYTPASPHCFDEVLQRLRREFC